QGGAVYICSQQKPLSGVRTAVGESDVAVEEGGQLGLGQGADLGRFDIAVLEQHQRGDTTDAILGRCVGVLIDVQLADLQLALIVAGDFVQNRGKHLARAAPFGPVIDQNR